MYCEERKLHSLIDSFVILAHLPNTYPADSVTSRELFYIKFCFSAILMVTGTREINWGIPLLTVENYRPIAKSIPPLLQ